MTPWLVLAFTLGCIAGYVWRLVVVAIIAEHEQRMRASNVADVVRLAAAIEQRRAANVYQIPRMVSRGTAPRDDGPRAA